MNINELIDSSYDFLVKGITDDSREVSDGYVFVCTKGYNVDHFDYICDAINNGCVFLVVDREIDFSFPHIVVDNINDYYKELCIKFYDIDLDYFSFIGITGTDGKTTTASITRELIGNAAYIGTNGVIVNGKNIITHNTTPCVNEFYKILSIIRDEGIKTVVMEVSSEALLHKRVDNIKFDIVAFTNITGDHLNVHKSFDNYLECKLKLLSLLKDNGQVIINGDDSYLQKINCKNLSTLGYDLCNDYVIHDIEKSKDYVKISVNDKYIIESPFIGKYNIYNIVEAFVIGLCYGIDDSLLIDRIKGLNNVPGRCEFLNFGQEYKIVLDYAHTVNGIKSILETFKDYKRIITVTGCAGGRDKSKRRVIGDMVIKNSDVSIFTMDDPRWEDVRDIIDEMVGDNKNYIRIIDRGEAIRYALSIADSDSVVLILGKGRDNYMAIGEDKVDYSDYDVVKNYYL